MASLLMPSTYRTDLPLFSRNREEATMNLAGVGRLSEQGRDLWSWTTSTRERLYKSASKAVVNLLRVL